MSSSERMGNNVWLGRETQGIGWSGISGPRLARAETLSVHEFGEIDCWECGDLPGSNSDWCGACSARASAEAKASLPRAWREERCANE